MSDFCADISAVGRKPTGGGSAPSAAGSAAPRRSGVVARSGVIADELRPHVIQPSTPKATITKVSSPTPVSTSRSPSASAAIPAGIPNSDDSPNDIIVNAVTRPR